TLLLDNNTGANVVNRLGSQALALSGAILDLRGNNNIGMPTVETLGPVTLAGGQSTILSGYAALPAAGASVTLTSTNLVRNAGATATFVGNNSTLATTTNRILFNQIGG